MSFWDDIVIGDGNKGNSAWLVIDLPHGCHISQNEVSYWISRAYLGAGLTIMKDTPPGRTLKKMIDAENDTQEIYDWLTKLVITKINPEVLMRRVENAIEESFEKGRQAQALLMRQALMYE